MECTTHQLFCGRASFGSVDGGNVVTTPLRMCVATVSMFMIFWGDLCRRDVGDGKTKQNVQQLQYQSLHVWGRRKQNRNLKMHVYKGHPLLFFLASCCFCLKVFM
jgi:hypothetical protein